MLSKLSFLAVALLSLSAVADVLPPPGPGGQVPPPGPRPVHPIVFNVDYACAVGGPGYLSARFSSGFYYTYAGPNNFMGNMQECEKQVASLTALRPSLAPNQLVSWCVTPSAYGVDKKTGKVFSGLWYRRTYTVDAWGGLVKNLPLVGYEYDYAKCLKDAEAINKR